MSEKNFDIDYLKSMRSAIREGNLTTVKNMIESDPELLYAETPFGTFLHDAAVYGKYDIAKYLVEKGADVNKHGGIGADSTPMSNAAFRGYLNIVELLYDNGAKLDVSTFESNPLFAAIYNDHMDIVKYLVEKGIDTKAAYAVGEIPNCDAYKFAKQYDRAEIASFLKYRA